LLYARVSTGPQETKGTSLDTQEAECRDYAAARNYQIVGVYREVFSGAELWERPQLGRVRELIRAGAVDVLLAHSIDRLSREPEHLYVVLSEAQHHGVAVEFVQEVLDQTPEGQLLTFVRGWAAKLERSKIRERTMRGKRARVMRGCLLPSKQPLYGYAWADAGQGAKERYVVDPETAWVVRRCFDAVLSGQTLRQIAAGLTQDGIHTRAGRRTAWTFPMVKALLSNEMYTGRAWANRWRFQDRRNVLRPESEWLPLPDGVVPAIIDDATFQAVTERLAQNQQHASRRNRNPEAYLLRAGFVRCAACGWVMATGVNRTWRFYACGQKGHGRLPTYHVNQISAATLDHAVWDHVKWTLLDPAILDHEIERLAAHDTIAADLDSLDRALRENQGKQANLLASLAEAAPVVRPLVLTDLEKHAQAEQRLQAERATLLRRRDEHSALKQRAQELRETVRQRLPADIDALSYEEKRLALTALAVAVRVWPGQQSQPRFEVSLSLPGAATVSCSSR
jgi:site-specific DNA recombinase